MARALGLILGRPGGLQAAIQVWSDGQIHPPPMFGARNACDSRGMSNNTTVPIKVFLAEDSRLIRDRVAAMLTTRAMDIVGQAATPQGCIDGILAAQPDVVVLDAQLAGGTGLQVLRAVRQTEPKVAFVALTINAEPALRKRYLDEGAQGFLDKAFEFGHLADTVEQASCHAQ